MMLLKGIGYIVLLAAVMLGWSAIVPKAKPKQWMYYYEYTLPEDSIQAGRTLVIQSVDTTVDGDNRATIYVKMAAR